MFRACLYTVLSIHRGYYPLRFRFLLAIFRKCGLTHGGVCSMRAGLMGECG